MKKLFISVPMRGRTEENIKRSMEKMHKIAEAVFEQELEVIPSYIEDRPPQNDNERIWYLSESIKLMAQANYFIGTKYCYNAPGCDIEESVARNYMEDQNIYVLPVGVVMSYEEYKKLYEPKYDCVSNK